MSSSPPRYKAVSKSTTARENLSTVWQLQNGKFDDGVAVHSKFGPHIKDVMDRMGVSEEDITTSVCRDCGRRYSTLARRCKDCIRKLAEGR